MRVNVIFKQNARKIFILLFLLFFFIIYYSILNYFSIFNWSNTLLIFTIIGFSIIIIVIFYIFLDSNKEKKNNNVLYKVKVITEDWIKIISIILMSIAIFIPPISESRLITDWAGIGVFTYFRAYIFLIGAIFIPGACIFNILYSNNSLFERFKIEPFLLKITIYPFISLTFLGITTLIIDILGVRKGNFDIILFLIIILLFLLDLIIKKYRNKTNFNSFFREFTISKYTILILLIATSIMIIAYGLFLSTYYGIFFDNYDGIGYIHYIGNPDRTKFSKLYTYNIYYSYIIFGLSSLCGIPPINTAALLFPFLYLFATTIYILIKALLIDIEDKYTILLASIFVITFSGLFYIINSFNEVSWLIFGGIFFFWFKSFAIFLSFISTALNIIVLKPSNKLEKHKVFRKENLITITLSSFFAINSLILYFLPILFIFIVTSLYFLFSIEKMKNFLIILIHFSLITIFFIIFDILLDFCFCYQITILFEYYFSLDRTQNLYKILYINALRYYIILILTSLLGFFIYGFIYELLITKLNKKKFLKFLFYFLIFNVFLMIYIQIFLFSFNRTPILFVLIALKLNTSKYYNNRIFLDTLLFSVISIGFLIVIVFIYMKYNRKKIEIKTNKTKYNKYASKLIKTILCLILFTFTILLIYNFINIFITKRDNFFKLYLSYIFLNFGIIGILGFYLSYFYYKVNWRLFFILYLWTFIFILLASILIFREWFIYSNTNPTEIPLNLEDRMNIWFTRLWYYSTIPLSIFSAFGLIRFKNYINSRITLKFRGKNLKTALVLVLVSSLILFSLSNTILSNIKYYESDWEVEGDDANIIGWISENISPEDKIITDDKDIYRLMQEFPYYTTKYFKAESKDALKNNICPIISYNYYSDCYLDYIKYLDGFYNVLSFNDYNDNGFVSFKNDFSNSIQSGNVQFWIRTTKNTDTFTIDLNDEEINLPIIRFMINSNGFYCYNNNSLEKIVDMLNNEWYNTSIFFECSNTNYSNLDQYHWKILINNTEYSNFIFMNNVSNIENFYAYSNMLDFNYRVYLKDLKYSWNSNIKDIIYRTQEIVLNNLKAINFKYYIKSGDSDYYKDFCDEINLDFNYFFLSIDEYLIANLYQKELYEHKNNIVYGTEN